MNITEHIRVWQARRKAARDMRAGSPGREELNKLLYVGNAAGYVTALYALLALARVEMDANNGVTGDAGGGVQ